MLRRWLIFGILFSWTHLFCSAQTITDTVFHTFDVQSMCPVIIIFPSCTGMMQASDGNYYGTTVIGGSTGNGTVYRITPSGKYSTVYSFTNGADGSEPVTSLIEGPNGDLYGIAGLGGAGNAGVVFELSLSGKLTTLYTFCYPTSCPEGEVHVLAPLIIGSDGNFYGNTGQGGDIADCSVIPDSIGCGFIFKLTPSGDLTVLHQLLPSEGDDEASALLEASDGNFYGVTPAGGILTVDPEGDGLGTVFKMTPSGDFTVLHQFSDNGDSAEPHAALVEANDSNLYGTTHGDSGFGTIFRITPDGTLTTTFNFLFENYKTTGLNPVVGLFPGSDGALYGTTEGGGNPKYCPGNDDCGTVYRMTTGGDQTILYQFCSQVGCADGYGTSGTLVQGSDGSLYGNTSYGGNLSDCQKQGCGTIYKLSSNPSIGAPVQLGLSQSTVSAESSVTLSWKVLNAFSLTMQQCYAFVQNSATGAGTWTGKQTGTYSSLTNLFTGTSTITPIAAGTYTYALTCGGIESGFATLTVTKDTKTASATALTASPTSPTVGQKVTLSATVTGSQTTPTGTVTFSVNGVTLGSAKLNGSGIAAFTASSNGIAPGFYLITSTYSGDSTNAASASKPLTVTLAKAPTSTTLIVSPNPVTSPASATLTASVSRSSGVGAPGGTITFEVKGFILGSAKVNPSGVATLSVSSAGIKAGSYPVSAAYSGDAYDVASTSAIVSVAVN